MATKEELLKNIAETETERNLARQKVSELKMAVLNAETILIEYNLRYERLTEELRVLNAKTISKELSDRDKDIERFRLIFPDLEKKL